ncbi:MULTISPECIES: RelA/SpoT domain-containing protein [unclassified Novosphingobium]|uniref:RelA/SpoT domain-containing protein n=1 Tax=unclassified Novosphingobium TaxID=2644732 RepID=UPI00149474DB|nr:MULTISPECIES: RelA/SpoT domain-containing protein [unclassified Novosphingobium]MBB3357044.1 ppGpp synthetase/RelA/SpoT-type nucleotidyltransferase [Novosphingobium sp. BK256]MBB3373445.1 ppGpp synthetase/RelA/SpoT-type nucleotidyltransferase [Novosphingobium sp. BK280]MBB3377814.1 ppGpp synthetase/RelA/SpoT-type nucleotidyltransferase [Novosphingobium sp. BK258]MBB3418775.1 ppGpp synthetase/RelA/SpoT-type nucleotidyltransferase [Novosphingobium sp. BK267]MBB3450390.1 ppGpp synthetase/RelA/
MHFDEYQLTGRATYAAFVDAVRTILVSLVERHGFTPHAITGRAKDPVSLKKKLAKNGIDPASAIDEVLKDLAGCRIVFLTNSQVTAFHATGAINENFDILNVNEHHPVPGTETEDRLFDSTNYLVALKPGRAVLPEYEKFAGLRIEIQVQTLLNHAWAEMGHDTIYKEPELRHVDPRHMQAINARMTEVMREHLLPAGYAFDKIARDFNRIIKADAAAGETLATIASSTNNDELLGAFESADTLILPMITDNSGVFVELVPQIAAAVERVRGTKGKPINSIMGNFPGKTGEIVAKRAADLIGRGLYVDPKLSFDTITRLYRGAGTDAERKIWADLGAQFASYTVDAWEKVGTGVQAFIVERIGALSIDDRRALANLILAMLAKVLSYEISGIRRGAFPTVLINTAIIPAGEGLRQLRAGAFDILEQMLGTAADDIGRSDILAPLWIAATPPHGVSEGLRIQIMADATRLLAFLQDHSATWGLELRRKTEIKALRVHRNFRAVPASMTENTELVATQEKLVPALLTLRDTLNADPQFGLYKALIGTDSVAPKAWEEDVPDFRGAASWRKERFPEIIAEADPAKAAEWVARLRAFLTMPANAADRYPLTEFVEALVQVHPGIGTHMLYQMDADLQPVLVRLLRGLDAAGEGDVIAQHVARFIGEGRFLANLALWLGRRDQINIALLATVGDRARELGDSEAVLETVNAAGHLFRRGADQPLIDRVFLPSAEYFRGSKDPFWNDRLMDTVDAAIVEGLDEAQSRTLLELFMPVPRIDYSGDLVLAVIARRFPGLVLDYFGARIVRDARSDPMRYEVVPSDIHELGTVLAENPRQLVAATREWYRKDPRVHEYRGGRLFRNVFPSLPAEASGPLREIAGRGDRNDLSFVLDTLAAYDGAEPIYPICMDIVDRLDAGDDLLGRVSQVLGERGVLVGDYGSVDADRSERAQLEAWLDDPREKVKAFAKDERRRLAQSMAQEQRRATGEIEHMKEDWGEPAAKAKQE